jgi:hypothetical protein
MMDKQKLWLKLNRMNRDLRMISLSIMGEQPQVEIHVKKAQEELEYALKILGLEIENEKR